MVHQLCQCKIPQYCAITLLVLCQSFQASAESVTLPFHPGEDLTFQVSWMGIGVGIATMKVAPYIAQTNQDHLRPAVWRLISTARTYRFFDFFHKVDDHAESLFNPYTRLPQHFHIYQHKGRRLERYEMTFDQAQHRVAYHRRDDPARLVPIETGVQDPLSVLYKVRTLTLSVGSSISVPIFIKGKTWVTEVQILKREQLDLPVGTINTIKVQPLLKDAGIFHRQGQVFIWFTDDMHRVPVQLQSNTKVGSIKARLIAAKGVQLTQSAVSHSGCNPKSEILQLHRPAITYHLPNP